jgi:hypothetical protein
VSQSDILLPLFAMWKQYEDTYRGEANEQMRAELRRCFFAGMLACMVIMSEAAKKGPEAFRKAHAEMFEEAAALSAELEAISNDGPKPS